MAETDNTEATIKISSADLTTKLKVTAPEQGTLKVSSASIPATLKLASQATEGTLRLHSVQISDLTLEVDSTVTVPYGQGAFVENTGTTKHAKLKFTIPAGNGIVKIELIEEKELYSKYRITFNDGTTYDYTIYNGVGHSVWGAITGDISDQTDLQNILTTLQTNITNEATTRANADTTLQNTITTETNAREVADTTLQTNITNEATTRANADTTLQSQITSINNTIGTYGDVVTHNASEFQLAGDYATNTALTEGLATKQDTINDLATIRSKANSAIQPNDNVTNLTNDAGYITKSVNNLDNYTLTSDLGDLATLDTVNYETQVTNKPSIPTKTSELTNDSGFQNASQVNTTVAGNVVDIVTSSSTTNALSANMGKALQEQVNNLKSIGRFLALWNCATGLAESDPTTSPRPYNSGDYFVIGNVGTINYRPSGSSYVIGQASTTIETSAIAVNDVYFYDGTNWILQINHGGLSTVSFSNITGQPSDNTNLNIALNAKQDNLSAGNLISLTNNTVAFTGTIPTKTSELTNDSGFITGITSSDVTTALGYTPYSSTNPSEYQTASQVSASISSYHDNTKQDVLTAGTDISITNNTISFTGTIPTKVSDLTDDTATYPVDKADTLTGLTATVSELNYCDGVTSNIQTQLGNKQATLVSGTNIKTINNNSLLGSGNITIEGAVYTAGTGVNISASNEISTNNIVWRQW